MSLSSLSLMHNFSSSYYREAGIENDEFTTGNRACNSLNGVTSKKDWAYGPFKPFTLNLRKLHVKLKSYMLNNHNLFNWREIKRTKIVLNLWYRRPNLKNLSRGSNMVGSTLNCIQFFKIYAGAQLKPVSGRFKPRFKFIKFGHWYIKFSNSCA